jgi:hypothetical protein
MSFPIRLAGRTFETPPDLARAVLADARAGGGTVVADQRPATWLAEAITAGDLPRPLGVGLCAALVQTGDPHAIVEAAAVAGAAGLTELSGLLPAALEGLDQGVLLTPDPTTPARSVEDALLAAWAALVQDPAAPGRDALLRHLRHAGLRRLELEVVARAGDPATLRESLPAILVEELPVDDVAVLAAALVRGEAVARAVCEASGALTASQRYAIWRAAVARDAGLEAREGLRVAWLAEETVAALPETH